VKEYIVEKKSDLKSNKWELLGRTKSTINRIRNLDPQQTYIFRVKAVNSFGESNPIVSDRFVTKSLESTTSNATPITTTTTTSTTTVKPIVMKTKDLTFSVTTPLKKSLSMNGVNQQVSQEANQNTWNTIEMASKMVDDDTDDLKTLAMLDRLPKPRDNDY
jgi:predicted phage tail protein